MRSILMKLSTAILGLLAIAQAPHALAAQAQIQQIDSDLPEERRIVEREEPAAAVPQTSAPQFDPIAAYRLTSDYLTAIGQRSLSLAISQSGGNFVVVMADTKDSPEQLWKFIPLGGGKYRLINIASGQSKSLSTQMSGSRYVLSIENSDGSTAQIWTLSAVADGKFRLSNDALAGRSLYISALDPSFSGFLLQMTATSTSQPKQVWALTKTAAPPLQLTNPTITTSGPAPTGGQPSGGGLVVTGLGAKFQPGLQLSGKLLCPIIGPGPKLINGCQPLFGNNPLSLRTSGPATYRGPAKPDACPYGFREDGDYCGKPESYGRGAGYPWKFGDAFDLSGARQRCEGENGGSGTCEQNGALYYPKCKKDFHAVGCCVCSPDCPDGWEDIGVSCKKPNTQGNCAAYGRVAGLGYAFYDLTKGNCWSCPVLMHRTFSAVDTQDALLPACTAGNDEGIVWQSSQYPEPGVAAFINPAIVQLAFNDVAYVDAFLTKRAGGNAARKQELWGQMINTPNESPEFKALIFATILLVAQKDQNYQTRPSDMVSIFEDYIQKRRTYVAKDAVAMYNAYLGFNAYKQNQGTKAAIAAGGPLGFISKGTGQIIVNPQAALSATVGVPPDDYVNAAYSAAVPDSRGEEFMRALADLGSTPYKNPSMGTASFDPSVFIQLGLNVIGSATAIHDLLDANKVIQAVAPLAGKSGIGIGLGMGLGGSVLDAVAAIMTVYSQQEAAKQYSQLVTLADKPESIAQILKSGSDDDKNSLIMWWALATSPYKPSATVREFPIKEADVCATYPSQCADIKRIVAAVHPTSPQAQPVTVAPAPPEFREQVNATVALTQLLSSAVSTAAANALKPGVEGAVQRLNQATLAVRNLSGAARAAADQHSSELEGVSTQLRIALGRIRAVPGVYPIFQSALAQLDPSLRAGGAQ